MPQVTLLFGAALTALGLYGYFGSEKADPSVTALIPAFVGGPLILCGLIAFKAGARKHAMHAAAALALLGALAAIGRGAMTIGKLFSDDPAVDKRPMILLWSMAGLCVVYVILCVRSFISARRNRVKAEG